MVIRPRGPLLFVALILLIPANALTQAWKPPKGKVFFSLNYQYLDAGDHLLSDPVLLGVDLGSKTVDFGTVQSQVVVLDADIGITDRLALNAAVAFVGSRYLEGGVHPFGPTNAEGPQDDGDWHSAFQDARVGARYVALNDGTWALTPMVSYGFPTTDYLTLGHAALGRKINELRVGLDWGRLLSIFGEPKAYLQGNYSYAFMEDVDDVSLDRSNFLVEFGYFLADFLTLQVWTDFQNTHGGTDTADLDAHHHDFEGIFLNHDRTLAADFWRLGGGVSVPVSKNVDVYGNVATTLWGINTHKALTVTFGMSWGVQMFGGGGRGIWEQTGDDPDEDMDDWLLEDLEEEDGKKDGNDEDGKKEGRDNDKDKKGNRGKGAKSK